MIVGAEKSQTRACSTDVGGIGVLGLAIPTAAMTLAPNEWPLSTSGLNGFGDGTLAVPGAGGRRGLMAAAHAELGGGSASSFGRKVHRDSPFLTASAGYE